MALFLIGERRSPGGASATSPGERSTAPTRTPAGRRPHGSSGTRAEKQKALREQGFLTIGAPGFEPGTSPTRITGKNRSPHGKALQIAICSPVARISDPCFCGGFPGFRQRVELLPDDDTGASTRPVASCRSFPQATAVARAQAPNRRLTTLALSATRLRPAA